MSILSNELKVGNIFKRELQSPRGLEYDNEFVLTEEWMGKLFSNDNSIALQDLFGVPLSPEWLVRLGFRPNGEGNILFEHPIPKVLEDEHKDLGICYPSFFFNKRLGRWMDCHTRVCIDYVHQLQNLYFINTNGEELTLKPIDSNK